VKRRAGLTLIEVLVAVVVCGAGIAVVASAVAGTVRAEAYAANLVRAADHVELILARVESGILPIEPDSGDFAEDGEGDLSWELEVETTQVEGLKLLRVTVAWQSHGVDRDLTVERQLFMDPLVGGIQ
jgi:hypothetical protein